jgi:integrase
MRAYGGSSEAKLEEGLSSGTTRVCVTVLSALYVDLAERGLARANPARGLPRSLARLIRSSHDPRTTPFVECLEDVRRIFLALDEPLNIGYALGAFAGLRPGETFALRWPQVDLEARRIHPLESVNRLNQGQGQPRRSDPRRAAAGTEGLAAEDRRRGPGLPAPAL